MNWDEYLCWDLVPKSALVKFLVFRSDNPNDYFLRTDFGGAASLGDFRKRFSSSPKLLTVDQYRSCVRSIVMEFTYPVYPVKDVDSFVKAIVECFLDPTLWGYKLDGNPELRPMFQKMITLDCAFGGYDEVEEL